MNDFQKEYQALGPSLLPKINKALSSGQYILGSNVKRFEKQFAAYIGTKYCVGVGNGMEAIRIALLGLGITKGDEVITVSNTDIATALAIVYAGATPVFVDVDEYYHINPQLIEKAITKKTKAILPVHLYGQVADMDSIFDIAKRHNLYVVEDACQAHGATFKGKRAGSLGHAGCFSFYPTKNLGAYGDAGAIVTSDNNIYKRCLMLRNRGQTKKYVYPILGFNSRLDEIQAAILLHKLTYLEAFNMKRQKFASLYINVLQSVPEITLPKTRKDGAHVFHLFVIQAQKRNQLQKYLQTQGIDTLVHYPIPIHKQKSFLDFKTVSLPKTERRAKRILSLPIHPYMTKKDVESVGNFIRSFYH